MREVKSLSEMDFNVSDVEISVSNGRISSVGFTDAYDGKRITLSACAGDVIFSGINTRFSLSSGSVKIGQSGIRVLWLPSK
jgi:hypothetical protein